METKKNNKKENITKQPAKEKVEKTFEEKMAEGWAFLDKWLVQLECPEERKKDLLWMKRNLGIKNSKKFAYRRVKDMIKRMLLWQEKERNRIANEKNPNWIAKQERLKAEAEKKENE